jgi:hypothetical protein
VGKRAKDPLRPHEVVEEEEDWGIPGKLYFDKPKLSLIQSQHKPLLPEYDLGPSGHAQQERGPDEFYLTEGKVRLKSSHGFPGYSPPEVVKYLLSRRPLQADADDYIKIHKQDGFGEGAIVARRYANPWRKDWHTNWGMITRVVQTVPWPSNMPWDPYEVKWFEGGVAEWVWAEELYVIHAHLDKDTLSSILEAQE